MKHAPLTGTERRAVARWLLETIDGFSRKPDAPLSAMIAAIPTKDRRYLGEPLLAALVKLTAG